MQILRLLQVLTMLLVPFTLQLGILQFLAPKFAMPKNASFSAEICAQFCNVCEGGTTFSFWACAFLCRKVLNLFRWQIVSLWTLSPATSMTSSRPNSPPCCHIQVKKNVKYQDQGFTKYCKYFLDRLAQKMLGPPSLCRVKGYNMDTSKKARANSIKHAASELTSLADIQSVLSHAKLLLGNSHKLFSPNSTFQEKSQKNIVTQISTVFVYYLPCPTKKTLTRNRRHFDRRSNIPCELQLFWSNTGWQIWVWDTSPTKLPSMAHKWSKRAVSQRL